MYFYKNYNKIRTNFIYNNLLIYIKIKFHNKKMHVKLYIKYYI